MNRSVTQYLSEAGKYSNKDYAKPATGIFDALKKASSYVGDKIKTKSIITPTIDPKNPPKTK